MYINQLVSLGQEEFLLSEGCLLNLEEKSWREISKG